MAWNNYNNQSNDEGKYSEFNSAGLKMKRLDKILSELNEINQSLRAFNIEKGIYNYELKLSLCDGMYQEIESKLTPKEITKSISLRSALIRFMKECNIHKLVKKKVYSNPTPIIDEVAFRVLENFLFQYETLVRKLQDAHGMDTFYGTDDEGL